MENLFEEGSYKSQRFFDEVDDESNILKNILTDNILNSYNKNDVPSHYVIFKVDDVCIVLRALRRNIFNLSNGYLNIN
jgi:hypothetical protein